MVTRNKYRWWDECSHRTSQPGQTGSSA